MKKQKKINFFQKERTLRCDLEEKMTIHKKITSVKKTGHNALSRHRKTCKSFRLLSIYEKKHSFKAIEFKDQH